MTGLMVEKPEDHLQFIVDSLKKVGDDDDEEDSGERDPRHSSLKDKGKHWNGMHSFRRKEDCSIHYLRSSAKKRRRWISFPVNRFSSSPVDRRAARRLNAIDWRIGTDWHISLWENWFKHWKMINNPSFSTIWNQRWKRKFRKAEVFSSVVILRLSIKVKTKTRRRRRDGIVRSLLTLVRQFESLIGRCRALIYLDVPDPILSKRLMHRGQNDTIGERLSTFHREMKPLLDYYSQQGKLIQIDGQREINEISDTLTREMEAFQVGKIPSRQWRTQEFFSYGQFTSKTNLSYGQPI